MPQSVEVVMSAQDANVVRTWMAIANAQQGYAQSLGLIDVAALKNAKSSTEFDRANTLAMKNAQQLLDSLITPQQKYQKNLENIASLHNRGLITVDQYLAAMKKEKAELDAQDPSVQQAIQRQKQLESIGKQVTASTATAAERYRNEMVRLNEIKAAGAIGEDAYARAVRSAREELLKASGHVSKREQAERELGAELKRNAELDAQRAALAQRILQSIQTPQQRYNQQLREFTALRKENRLSEEEYAAAVKKSKSELESTHRAGEDLFGSLIAKAGPVVAGFVSVGAVFSGIKTAIEASRDANREFLAEVHEGAKVFDKIFRQYNIQAGIKGIEGDKAKDSILKEAEIAGFSEEKAASAATALVSSGVDAASASGGALRGLLGTLNAQGLRDADPAATAEAMTSILQANKLPVNEQTMTQLGVQLQSEPIKATKLKASNLPQLSKVTSDLSSALSQQEQLAMYAIGGSELGSFDTMATQMKDIFKNIQIAAGKKDAQDAAQSIGLDLKKADFQGENFEEVMLTLRKALAKAKPEDRKIVLGKLVEGGNIGTFDLIDRNLERILQTAKDIDSPEARAQYEADVAAGSSGRAPAEERQKLRRRKMLAERDTQSDLMRAEVVQASLDRGQSPFMQRVAGLSYDFGREFQLGDYFGGDNDAFAASLAQMVTDEKKMSVATGMGQRFAGTAILGQTGASIFDYATGNDPFGKITDVGRDAAEAANTTRATVDRQMGSSFDLAKPAQQVEAGDNRRGVAPAMPVILKQEPQRPAQPDPGMVVNNQLLQSIDTHLRQLASPTPRPNTFVDARADTRPPSPVRSYANDDKFDQKP